MRDYFRRTDNKLNPFHLLLAFYLLIALAGIIYRILK
jgi:hypothetical protein